MQVTDVADALLMVQFFDEVWRHGTVVVATTDFSIGVVLAMILLVPLLLFLCAYLYHHCQQVKKEKKAKENNETGTSITGDLELQSNPMTTIINDPPKKL